MFRVVKETNSYQQYLLNVYRAGYVAVDSGPFNDFGPFAFDKHELYYLAAKGTVWLFYTNRQNGLYYGDDSARSEIFCRKL